MVYLLFHNFHFRQVHLVAQAEFLAEAVFRTEVLPVQVEVRWFLCTSCTSADSVLGHLAWKAAIRTIFY
jgi:hypothetical protein